MNTTIATLKNNADMAKAAYKTGTITRAEAIKSITPYIEAVNNKATEIAKKYNMKPKLCTVVGYLR